MKNFLKNIGIFLSIVTISILAIFSMADGTSDPFYLKFTKPKQTSLIVGTSKAAIGIRPEIINKYSEKINEDNELFNYAFTLIHSPYGKTYYESIKSKVDQEHNTGVHIITVCPWSLSSRTKYPEDSLNFREVNLTLSRIKNTSQDFNFQYLWDAFEYQYVNIPLKRMLKPKMKLHEDGWLEMNLPMDTHSLKKRHEQILNVYKNDYFPVYQFSQNRFDYLKKTINLLKENGEVYLVRLPVHQDFLDLENQYLPQFNDLMQEIMNDVDVYYFDMSPLANSYNYIDGNHLDNESAEKVSNEIRNWIDNDDLHVSSR